MTTYNSVIERQIKLVARQSIPGGASSLAEAISSALIASLTTAYGSTDIGYTWPEYIAGVSYPSWVDDVVLHTSTGNRLHCRQIRTNINETQVFGTPSPYGPPPQTDQRYYRNWAN